MYTLYGTHCTLLYVTRDGARLCGQDVMELIGQLDATQETRELLLDSFFQVTAM